MSNYPDDFRGTNMDDVDDDEVTNECDTRMTDFELELEKLNDSIKDATAEQAALGNLCDKVLDAIGNPDNRRAKFPTRLADGESHE